LKNAILAVGPTLAIMGTVAICAPEFFDSIIYWPFAIVSGIIGGVVWSKLNSSEI